MYLQHFQLDKIPYSLSPDPYFLFLTRGYREALAALLFCVSSRKGFAVLVGETGTGKTTLIRSMLSSLPSSCTQVSVIVNPVLSRSELLDTVLLNFGERNLPSSKALRLSILDQNLRRAQQDGRTSVLVIDEAHLLTPDLLEEVRLLSNFEADDQKLIQILLVGQPELNKLLDLDSMRPIRQRIAIKVHIEALSPSDVSYYMTRRWARAHSSLSLPFSADAICAVAQASKGNPRLINVICDAALMNAFGADAASIDTKDITEVVHDLDIPIDPGPLRTASGKLSELPAYPHELVSDLLGEAIEKESSAKVKRTRTWNIAHWFNASMIGTK